MLSKYEKCNRVIFLIMSYEKFIKVLCFIVNILQIVFMHPHTTFALNKCKIAGNIYYQLEKNIDEKGLIYNLHFKEGCKLLNSNNSFLFPYLEVVIKYDDYDDKFNNAFEINPCIEFHYDVLSIGSKYSFGYYLPRAQTDSSSINKKIYDNMEIYVSYWCQFKRSYTNKLSLVMEEFFNCSYRVEDNDIIKKNNLTFDYCIELGLQYPLNRFAYIKPIYKFDLSVDKKGLPWNNILTHSFGFKFMTSKKKYSLSFLCFSKLYTTNAYFINIENQNWDYDKDELDYRGVKILLSYFNEW